MIFSSPLVLVGKRSPPGPGSRTRRDAGYFRDLLRLRNISTTPVKPAPATAIHGVSLARAATRAATRPEEGGGARLAGRNSNLATAQKKGGNSRTPPAMAKAPAGPNKIFRLSASARPK